MALSDGNNQGEGRIEEDGVPGVQDGAGQPGVRPTQTQGEEGVEPSARGYRPAVMQLETGPGRMDQSHTGQEVPRIQSCAGPEALHPPASLQDSRVKYGEGGPHHPGTKRLPHEKVTNASSLIFLS